MKVLIINNTPLLKIELYLEKNFWDIYYFHRFDFQILQIINKIYLKNPTIIQKIFILENNLYSKKLSNEPNQIKNQTETLIKKNIHIQKIFNKLEKNEITKNKLSILKTIFFFINQSNYIYIDDPLNDIDYNILERLKFIQKTIKNNSTIFIDNFGSLNQKNKNNPSIKQTNQTNIPFKNIHYLYFPNLLLNILILICSCNNNLYLKNIIEKTYLSKLKELNLINFNFCFIIGDENNNQLKLNNSNSIEIENNILIINNKDDYQNLPDKIIKSYHHILSQPKFSNINKIIKIDDDIYLDIINLLKINLEMIEYGGHISSNQAEEKSNYYIMRGKGENPVPFALKGEWATGGCYILDFKLLLKIKEKIVDLINNTEDYYFEDQLIAKLLLEEKIKPVYLNNHLLLYLEGFNNLKIIKDEKLSSLKIKLENTEQLNKNCYHLDFYQKDLSLLRKQNLQYFFEYIHSLIERKNGNNI